MVTHTDSDHSGGAAAVLGSTRSTSSATRGPPGRRSARRGPTAWRSSGSAPGRRSAREACGCGCSGRPARLAAEAGPLDEPNLLSIVALARCRGFRMLLTGDAEAELAPVHPGDVDVLKVAHHGSEDAGSAPCSLRRSPSWP